MLMMAMEEDEKKSVIPFFSRKISYKSNTKLKLAAFLLLIHASHHKNVFRKQETFSTFCCQAGEFPLLLFLIQILSLMAFERRQQQQRNGNRK
jgi:hypothetical protein